MSEKRKNLIRWLICIFGLIGSVVVFAPGLDNLVIDPPKGTSDLRGPNQQYPIPLPHVREEGLRLTRPFLFELADSDKMKGREREDRLLARYESILDRLDGESLPPIEVRSAFGTATVMVAGEAFLTVLPQDCPEYFGRLDEAGKVELQEEVAYAWARAVQDDLLLQSVKRNPAYLTFYNFVSVFMFFVVCMGHLTLNWISRRFAKSPLWSIKLLLWLVYFTTVTWLHPSLDEVAHLLSRGALGPTFNFIIVGIVVALLHQLTHLALNRYLDALGQFESDHSVRAAQRRQTLEQAWTFVSKVGWTFLGLCLFLSSCGIDLSQFFAGAGLLGVAIGVMARDMFLDFFNGANILAEDQFGVGDWIESNNEAGEVVAFNLRSTKIRKPDGGLATIPNSDLRRVKNHSNEFSVVDFRVTVAYQTDTDYAMALIMEEIAFLETEWQDKLAAPPEPQGVQELGPTGVTLRVRLKTVPLAQWETQRRLNARVKKRFDKEGVEFAGAYQRREVRMIQSAAPES